MLRIKLAKQEKVFQQENQSLTDDYKNLTEQYKELQKKFKHFQLADSKRFKEIWKMNEDDAKEMMRKVLQVNKTSNKRLIVSFMSSNWVWNGNPQLKTCLKTLIHYFSKKRITIKPKYQMQNKH
jgi:hypothetical protein